MKRRLLAVIGILAMLMGLLPGSVFAAEPVPGPDLTVNIAVVNGGAGGQSDPHVSGDWVSYTDGNSIRFQDLDLGFASDRLVPRAYDVYDSRSDISGNTIVFTRMTLDSQGIHSQGIYEVQIDPSGDPGTPVEVSPVTGALPLRDHVAIGGDTIAYEDRSYGGLSVAPPEISLSSASDPAAPAYRLTNDTLADQLPAVSPTGDAVVWLKCSDAITCDVWRAERTSGAWGAPEQVTGAAIEWLPDTNGPATVYGSDAGGDVNIRWAVKDSSGAYIESVLDLPGIQQNPNIAGDFIAFESRAAPGTPFDLWLYDMATNSLYQLTDTPVSESLTDISTGPGGLVRVAWAEPKQVPPYDMDAYVLSALLPPTNEIYSFDGFFDPIKNVPGVNAMKAGAAVPVKFSLGGDQGLDIFAAGFPTSEPVSCAILKSSSGTVRTVTAGSSSLSYDPETDQYIYTWKTDKQWAGTCRVLTVQLDDGTQHLAYFRFK